jgi:hypothetical protein
MASPDSGGTELLPIPDYIQVRTVGLEPERYAQLLSAVEVLGLSAVEGFDQPPAIGSPELPEPVYVTEQEIKNFAGRRLYPAGMATRLLVVLRDNATQYDNVEEAQALPYRTLGTTADEDADSHRHLFVLFARVQLTCPSM